MMKYLRLFWESLKLELSTDMAYKLNFFFKVISLIIADIIGPLIAMLIYSTTSGIPGWSFEEFILFQGTFILVFGINHFLFITFPFGIINDIRQGTFDKILVKPYNPLLYLSSTSIDVEGLAEVFVGILLIIWAALRLDISLSVNTLFYLVIILCALVFLYALMVLIASLSFIFIKSFALLDLFFKMVDLARYPLNIYNAELRFFMTFIFPIAIVSSYPAQALLRGFSILRLVEVILPVIGFLIVTLFIWKYSLKKYTSSGG